MNDCELTERNEKKEWWKAAAARRPPDTSFTSSWGFSAEITGPSPSCGFTHAASLQPRSSTHTPHTCLTTLSSNVCRFWGMPLFLGFVLLSLRIGHLCGLCNHVKHCRCQWEGAERPRSITHKRQERASPGVTRRAEQRLKHRLHTSKLSSELCWCGKEGGTEPVWWKSKSETMLSWKNGHVCFYMHFIRMGVCACVCVLW